jgi:hypothetical protein
LSLRAFGGLLCPAYRSLLSGRRRVIHIALGISDLRHPFIPAGEIGNARPINLHASREIKIFC